MFDRFGSADGGMFMILEGLDHARRPFTRRWFIIARNGEGPHIPTVPAIVLARKAAAGTIALKGACACVGLLSLEEYLHELEHMAIETYVS